MVFIELILQMYHMLTLITKTFIFELIAAPERISALGLS